jgi:AcrR family transcriptional regulator
MIFQSVIKGTPSKSEQARLKLLEAGLEQFGQHGPEGASVRAIASAAGQNVAAISYYFGSKEKFYHAVLEGVISSMRFQMADVFAEIEALRQQPKPAPAEAMRLLHKFLTEIYLRKLCRDEAVAVVRLIVREQLHPSYGFDTLYQQGFLPLHEALAFLLGVALGLEPSAPETIVRTTSIMGQVYFFMMTREATLRRFGWSSLEGEHSQFVANILSEHINTLVSGLVAARKGRAAKTNRL